MSRRHVDSRNDSHNLTLQEKIFKLEEQVNHLIGVQNSEKIRLDKLQILYFTLLNRDNVQEEMHGVQETANYDKDQVVGLTKEVEQMKQMMHNLKEQFAQMQPTKTTNSKTAEYLIHSRLPMFGH